METPIPFKLFGLQRTGTNLMQWLVTENFLTASLEAGNEWKHGRVEDPGRLWHGTPFHFVWCVKNPYAWLVSCHRYFKKSWRADRTVAPQFRDNPEMTLAEFIMTPTYEFQTPVHRWNEMNRHWMTHLPADRTFRVHQEEMVEHQEKVLMRLQNAWKLTKRNQELATIQRHVGCNMRKGPPISVSYYQERQYLQLLSKQSMDFINQYLDRDLLIQLGYTLESPVAHVDSIPSVIEQISPSPGSDVPVADGLTEENVRERFELAAQKIGETGEFPGHGRGIVICGGGERYYPSVWVCVHMLRHLGCQLPIELWHLGQGEINNWMRDLLTPLGVTCVDAAQMRQRHPCRILNGWELKPYALTHSQFQEILLLDADNVPVVDPTFLFETPEFKQTGAIFWPDFQRLAPERSIWRLTGNAYRDEPEFESGQILIDKYRCRKPLSLTLWMNEYSDFWYRHVHGDKETFHMAWRKLNAPYAMPSTPIFALPATMCQHDFEGRRIFQHRNMAKWHFRNNPQIEGFLFEVECRGFLEKLLPHWNQMTGISIFNPKEKSREDIDAAQDLCNIRWIYNRVGYDQRPMRFCADGTIGEGGARCEQFWNLHRAEGNIFLEIQSQETLTCRLKLQNGAWYGRWAHHEKMPIELRPLLA